MNVKSCTLGLMLAALSVLSGCFSSGGGGGGEDNVTPAAQSVYSCYSSFKVSGGQVTGTFCDGSITSGAQASVIHRSFLETLWGVAGIPNAYAIPANEIAVSCVENTQLDLDVTVMNSVTTTISVNCDSEIDTSVRKELVKTFAGQILIAEYSGGGSVLAQGRILDFTGVVAGDVIGDNDLPGISAVIEGDEEGVCRNKYTFQNDGTVKIELNETATNAVGDGMVGSLTNVQYCYNQESDIEVSGQPKCRRTIYFLSMGDKENKVWDAAANGGLGGFTYTTADDPLAVPHPSTLIEDCSEVHYTIESGYRFRDGFIEIDPYKENMTYGLNAVGNYAYLNGEYTFSDGVDVAVGSQDPDNQKLKDYSRFCIKKVGVNECNAGAYQNYVALPEI